MKRKTIATTLALMLASYAPALADNCEIEDWRYQQAGKHIEMFGATTCRNGLLYYRLYDADGNFITSGMASIDGYQFHTFADGQAPSRLSIKYSIEKF